MPYAQRGLSLHKTRLHWGTEVMGALPLNAIRIRASAETRGESTRRIWRKPSEISQGMAAMIKKQNKNRTKHLSPPDIIHLYHFVPLKSKSLKSLLKLNYKNNLDFWQIR